MTDVTTVYIAIVTGVFTVIGATIPQAAAVIQTARQARRLEREQFQLEKRDACVALLRSAAELRTQIANNHAYQGAELAPRLELVRQHSAATKLSAVSVALLVSQPLGSLATELATAASRLAVNAEDNPKRPPDYSELDNCVAAFTTEAIRSQSGGAAHG
jgi:hypothetical protein